MSVELRFLLGAFIGLVFCLMVIIVLLLESSRKEDREMYYKIKATEEHPDFRGTLHRIESQPFYNMSSALRAFVEMIGDGLFSGILGVYQLREYSSERDWKEIRKVAIKGVDKS